MAPGEKSSTRQEIKEKAKHHAAAAVEIYGKFDHRSLGLARIGLGLLLLHDLVRRLPGIAIWYSNEGILPNHTVLWRPMSDYMFSFFFAASRTQESAVMFAFCAIVFLAFTVGYHSRFSHVLSFACLVSMQYREAFLENGGDIALKVLCAWTMFLPMGARFSVDAVRASLAARREHTAAELDDRVHLRISRMYPVASLAFFAILLQLATIYYFNAVNKRGWTWHLGSAVHYVLYQERMVTWFGFLIRDHVGMRLSRFLTYSTLGMELAAPILLLTPFSWQWARRVAVILLPLMHLAFAACLNLGQFSFNMIGYFPLLLTAWDWDVLGQYLGPNSTRARVVYVRETSPLAFGWARLLSRLDAFERLRFVAAVEGDARPRWEVENPSTGRRASGGIGLAECLPALPCGPPISFVLRLPVIRSLVESAVGLMARNEATLARWLRLTPARAARLRPLAPPTPAHWWLRRRLAEARELAVVILLVGCTSQLLIENNAIPKRLKLPQPKWITQLIWYPRLTQGWQMFSPDAPTTERMLSVDAVTFGGRHVDPFNEAGSRVSILPMERIPPHLEQDEFFHDYTRGIPENEAYWRALKEWIFNYHNRTGRTENRIISFEARLVESEMPPPGETEPRNIKTKVMFSARE